jgi:FkbM family methyltransferase
MIKSSIKKIFRVFGYDIQRLTARSNAAFQLRQGLRNFNVDLIFDIGANVGQFALELRSVGFTGNIVSFEPLTSAHAQLCQAAEKDQKWQVFRRCAVGHFDGEIQINIGKSSSTSSILPIHQKLHLAADGASYVGSEITPIIKLDSVSMDYLCKTMGKSFIKIDTQGFEWQVLDGASMTMKHVQGILCELSLAALYDGQHLWMDIIDRLRFEGFALWAILPGFVDPRDGRTLQFDAIFFRTKSGNWYFD